MKAVSVTFEVRLPVDVSGRDQLRGDKKQSDSAVEAEGANRAHCLAALCLNIGTGEHCRRVPRAPTLYQLGWKQAKLVCTYQGVSR